VSSVSVDEQDRTSLLVLTVLDAQGRALGQTPGLRASVAVRPRRVATSRQFGATVNGTGSEPRETQPLLSLPLTKIKVHVGGPMMTTLSWNAIVVAAPGDIGMNKNFQEGFEKSIAEYDERERLVRPQETSKQSARTKFETDWANLLSSVVVPALNDVRTLMVRHGWQCDVSTHREDASFHRDQTAACDLYRGDMHAVGGRTRPHLTFKMEKHANVIGVHAATTGSSGSQSTATLDEINAEYVHEQALNFFNKLVAEFIHRPLSE
jgi:hypothetical protein